MNRTFEQTPDDQDPDPLSRPMSLPFGLKESRHGYRINRLARSMRDAESRAAFLADEGVYMSRFHLDEREQALVVKRDWLGLQAAGGNQYALVKLAATLGVGLVQQGAMLRGESLEAFMATRPIRRRAQVDEPPERT